MAKWIKTSNSRMLNFDTIRKVDIVKTNYGYVVKAFIINSDDCYWLTDEFVDIEDAENYLQDLLEQLNAK